VGYIRWPSFHLKANGVLEMVSSSVFLWRRYKNIATLFGP
jgi:hypothetical protein